MKYPLKHSMVIRFTEYSYALDNERLELVLFLPYNKEKKRHILLLTPEGEPVIHIDDIELLPRSVSLKPPRMIDYGIKLLPLLDSPNYCFGSFHICRIEGFIPSTLKNSYLIISEKPDINLEGKSISEIERTLWGIPRSETGITNLIPSSTTAGSTINFYVTYTSGPKGLPKGALIRFLLPWSFSKPQANNKKADGYVKIENESTEIEIIALQKSVEYHERYDVICSLKKDLPPGETFSLEYTTRKNYISLCNFNEHPVYWYSRIPPLTAGVAISKDHPFVPLEKNHSFKIVPGKAERLHLFLPGRRTISDRIVLKGLITDRYRNSPPTSFWNKNIKLILNSGNYSKEISPRPETYKRKYRFSVNLENLKPGIYRVLAYDQQTGEEIARSNPLEITINTKAKERVFWGEFHVHTKMCDGCGEISEVFRHAKDDAAMDFAGTTSHAEYITDKQWEKIEEITNSWNDPDNFVALIGYEWIGNQRDRTILTSKNHIQIFRGDNLKENELSVLWDKYRGDNEIVAGVHALLAHHITEDHWEKHDESIERFIEIYSMWGACDSFSNPLIPEWVKRDIHNSTKKILTANKLIEMGYKLGFTGGGDSHDGHAGFSAEDTELQGIRPHTLWGIILYRSGMTAALLPRLDRKALINAIRNRKTYATTGARILLDFSVSGFPMGSIGVSQRAVCRAEIHTVKPLKLIEIVRNGNPFWVKETNKLDEKIECVDTLPPNRENSYYLRVVQEDGETAWSSPVWISRKKLV